MNLSCLGCVAKAWRTWALSKLDSEFRKPVGSALIASTRQVSRADKDDDPAHQQGQDIEREPSDARPLRDGMPKGSTLEEEQVDGVAGGAGADVETEDDAERAVDHVIAGKPVALIEPQDVNRREQDERPQ